MEVQKKGRDLLLQLAAQLHTSASSLLSERVVESRVLRGLSEFSAFAPQAQVCPLPSPSWQIAFLEALTTVFSLRPSLLSWRSVETPMQKVLSFLVHFLTTACDEEGSRRATSPSVVSLQQRLASIRVFFLLAHCPQAV